MSRLGFSTQSRRPTRTSAADQEVRPTVTSSHEDGLNNLPRYIRKPEMPSLEFVGQLGMVHAQATENGGLQIVNVRRIFHHVVAVIVRLAIADARLDAAARHPHRKAAAVMV